MTAWIVYNGFWNAAPPPPVVSLVAAAKRRGLVLVPKANTEIFAQTGTAAGIYPAGPLPAVALFWDKDTRLAHAMEAAGMRLYNSASAVERCDDKSVTHLRLAQAGIPMPLTFTAPFTYTRFTPEGDAFLRQASDVLGFPLVVKECYGSLGGQVYLAEDGNRLRRIADTLGAKPFLLQKFIPPGGRDKRLYVVGGQVVAAMTRENPHDFRANIAFGAHGKAYTPTGEETALALACAGALGCDIAGVDMLDGPLVLEVNSSARTAEISRCTGIDVDDQIIRYVLQKEETYAAG